MTIVQRRRHLLMWCVIAPLVVVGLVLGLVARGSRPARTVPNATPSINADGSGGTP